MSLIWITTNYNFFLISFALKYFPGNIFTNAYAVSLSEGAGYAFSAFIFAKFGLNRTFFAFSALSAVSGFLMVWGQSATATWIFPFLVLFAKFGQSSIYLCMYLANAEVFPSAIAATLLGFCSFFGHVAAIIAPIIVEASYDIAMWLFPIFATVACVISLFVRPI